MKRSRFLIHLASLLMPPRQRGEWSREWLAELHHAHALGFGGDAQLIRFARGAFQDALWHRHLWHRQGEWSRDALAAKTRSARCCLAGLAGVILLIIVTSGFLPITRSILRPLPYSDANRIATASDGGSALATRSALRAAWASLWQSKSKLLEGAEVYLWQDGVVKDSSGRESAVLTARVSHNFFALLGAHSSDGQIFERNRFTNCESCVVLSYSFWKQALDGKPLTPDTRVVLDGRPYRVAAILERNFWFLSRDISIWPVTSLARFANERTGVAVRLGPDVTAREAEQELSSILQDAGVGSGRGSLVQVAPVSGRVRSVFASFGLALGLAIVTSAANSRFRLPRVDLRGTLFFTTKTLLLLAAVFLAGVEFTHAPLITMLGGADLLTEPLSTWLFLLGCMGALLWSFRDQQDRCPVCLRRLGLPMRVGCPGCLLFDWAGTELVCVEGHGMLHIPEMVTSWNNADQWSPLDDSWQALFERS